MTLGIAIAGALFSGYLTALEGFVIDAWCAWCLTSAVLWTVRGRRSPASARYRVTAAT